LPVDDRLEPGLPDKILALHQALDAAQIGHAFGGALALAYATADPRTTADVDINIALPAAGAAVAIEALPPEVEIAPDALERILQDEQVRVWWGRTPVDLFFRAHEFHDGVAARATQHRFAGRTLPFVCANDLATLKALFDRPKDWLDIAAMHSHGSIDLEVVAEQVGQVVGAGDDRVDRLRNLAGAGS
jgi:pimeloyl-ACP methyl ester carboxylesterase